MTAMAPSLPQLHNPVVPSDEEKKVLSEYVTNLKNRGFCKLDDAASNQTRLYNRINGRTLPTSFITNDFDRWLYKQRKSCSFKTLSYITYTLPHVIGSKFVPIDEPFFTEPQTDCMYVNTYRRYSPSTHQSVVSPLFLEYLERLVPDCSERHILTQWLAHIFQRPSERPSWHILLTSDVGTGKGFLLEGVLHPLLHHTSVVNSFSKIMGQFSTMLEDNLLVLLDDPAQGSDDTQTKLKSLLSEERAYTERKGYQGGMVKTYTRFILASNDSRPLFLDATERRWWSPAPLTHKVNKKETQQFIQELAKWLEMPGSLCAVYNWLMEYELEDFNPKHVDQSRNLTSMIGLSKNVHTEFIKNYIEENPVFTNADLMLAFDDEQITRPNSRQVPHLLREAGYINGRPRINGKLTKLCHPVDMDIEEIRDAYEERNGF